MTAVFEREVAKLQRVVARNAWLELNPGPGVQLRRVIGVASRPSQRRGLIVQLGDLTESQSRDVMVHVIVEAHHDGAQVELMDATYNYVDAAQNNAQRKLSKFFGLKASSDEAAIREGVSPEIEHHATRFRVADLIVQAIAQARSGHAKRAKQMLRQADKIATAGAKRFADPTLEQKAAEARRLQKTVHKLAPRPTPPVAGGVRGRPIPRPAPRMSPAGNLDVRRAHGGAMDVINGER